MDSLVQSYFPLEIKLFVVFHSLRHPSLMHNGDLITVPPLMQLHLLLSRDISAPEPACPNIFIKHTATPDYYDISLLLTL